MLEYDEHLSESDKETLDDLIESLKYFITGREYFKTMYYKREFSNFSTILLVVSLPVIVFVTYVLVALDAKLFPEISALGFSPLTLFINFSYTVTLAPFVLLTSYVLRAATVTKRTPSAGPFATTPDEAESVDDTTELGYREEDRDESSEQPDAGESPVEDD